MNTNAAWAVLLPLLLGAGLVGCDQNVKFSLFTSKLNEARSGGTRYFPTGGDARECGTNPNHLELNLLPLTSTRDRKKVLLQPNDLLDQCILSVQDGRDDDGRTCYFGSDDIKFINTTIERADLCCVGPDANSDICLTRGAESATCSELGAGWTCDPLRNICQHGFALKSLELEWSPVGIAGRNRVVAMLMDNSGSLAGMVDGVPQKPTATDRTLNATEDNRIAAAKDFALSLDSGRDRVAVYAFDGAADSGVTNVTGGLAEPPNRGYLTRLSSVGNTIIDLGNKESQNREGSPVYDAIVRAVADLRAEVSGSSGNASIVLFTDGPPVTSSSTIEEAVTAVLGPDLASASDDIPVFVVHLDNPYARTPDSLTEAITVVYPIGRSDNYARLACVSGGSYFYVDDPGDLGDVFTKHLAFLSQGRYRLKTGYETLGLSDAFEGGRCYTISTEIVLTIEGRERSLVLDVSASQGQGARFDTRIFVCKP